MPSIPAAKNANKEGKANLTYILEARCFFLSFITWNNSIEVNLVQGNLAIFNTGMAKTTTEDSDTDESYDSLPELVACTDDEVRKVDFICNFRVRHCIYGR